jgi:preprotein translocase subunit YajC
VFLAQGGGEGSLLPLFMIVAVFAVFYFLMIRPQQRRRREAAYMQSSLTEGDQVVTIGGLHGTIAELDDHTVILETSDGVFSRYERAAIGRKVEPDEGLPEAEAGADPAREQRDKD